MGKAKKFEFINHTADLGIRARGRTLKELFLNLAEGMLETVADTALVEEKEIEEILVEAPDVEELLVSFLRELIFLQSAREWVFKSVEIKQIKGNRLQAVARGEKLDLDKHRMRTEIKAATYHGLKVEKTNDEWQAEVIFDV